MLHLVSEGHLLAEFLLDGPGHCLLYPSPAQTSPTHMEEGCLLSSKCAYLNVNLI